MSNKVMSTVWLHSKSRSGDLLVLLALADFLNDEGLAWPSIPTLGKKARLSPRQVKRALDRLQRLGELIVLRKQGPHGVNFYRIILGDNLSPPSNVLWTTTTADGDILGKDGDTHVTHGDILGKDGDTHVTHGDILGKEVVTWASPNPLKRTSERKKESGVAVNSVDNSPARELSRSVRTVGELDEDRMIPIGDPINFLSPGLQESFSKHFKDDQQ